MRLVYLSPVPWVSFAQRPHKFVEWFHGRTGEEVLWVDPYPTRFPSLSDFRRIGVKKSQVLQSLPEWLLVINPFALPIEPLPGSGIINHFAWCKVLGAVDDFASIAPTLVGIGKPSQLAIQVIRRLGQCRSVYDAMDDFPAFYNGFSRWAMQRREHELVRNVSEIMASSTLLKQRWSACRSDVRLVHNGLDANLLPTPRSHISLGERKVWGYVGTIAAWFDWDWVVALAKTRPSDVVRLIGPVFSVPPNDLPGNIELLPPCDHRAALLAMQDFDVGLIPFHKNGLTASVDPIKYYEYRALGLPVVSTDFGEMVFRSKEEGVFLSYQLSDIFNVAQQAIQHTGDVDRQIQFLKKNTWQARFDSAGIV